MKGKRNLFERMLVFLTALVMVANLMLQPVGIMASAADRSDPGAVVQEIENGSHKEGNEVPVSDYSGGIPMASVSGVVTANGTKLDGAEVTITDTITKVSETLITEADGKYLFTVETGKNYTVTASKDGFVNGERSISNLQNDLSNENLSLSLDVVLIVSQSTSWTVHTSYELKVKAPVDGMVYSWSYGNGNMELNGSQGTSITCKPLSTNAQSDTITVQGTGPYGTTNGTYQVPSVGLYEPAVSLSASPNSGKQTEVTLTAVVTGVEEGKVTFSSNKSQGSFSQNDVTVDSNGSASCKYQTNDSDGFKGEIQFTASYSGVSDKYDNASGSISPIYAAEREISYTEKDMYGNAMTDAIPKVQIAYGTHKEGKNYVIPVDRTKSDVPNAQYTYQVVEGNDSPAADAPYIVNNGDLTFTRASRDNEVTRVKVTRTAPGYANAVKYIEIFVEKKEVQVTAQTGDVFRTSKIFDKVKEISIEPINGTVSLEGILDSEQDGVSISQITGTINNENAGHYAGERMQMKAVTLEGTYKDNYIVKIDGKSITGDLTVNPRSLNLNVSDGKRQYYHPDSELDFGVTPKISVADKDENNNTGFVDSMDVDTVELPDVIVDITKYQTSSEEILVGDHDDFLVPSVSNSSIAADNKNYKFAWNTLGKLTVEEETIAQSNIWNYLDVADISNIYTEDGGDSGKKIWVKKGSNLKIVSKNPDRYNRVMLLDGTDITNGYEIKSEEISGENSIKVYLQKGNTTAKSTEFQIHYYADGDAPKAALSDVLEDSTAVDDIIGKLTFGFFDKKVYKIKASIIPEEKAESGVKNWYYAVIQIGKDIDKDSFTQKEDQEKILQDYVDGEQISWSEGPSNGEILVGKDDRGEEQKINENYIVLVKPYDNVNNSKIYTTRGIILDNHMPTVSIEREDLDKPAYAGEINLKACISDLPEDKDLTKNGSGIKNVYCQAVSGNDVLTSAEDIVREGAKADSKVKAYNAKTGITDQTMTRISNLSDKRSYTLQEIREGYSQLSLEFKVKAGTDNSYMNNNNVRIKVVVEDNAGNISESTTNAIKMDITPPVIEKPVYQVKREPASDGKEYYQNQKLTFVVRERNFTYDTIKFDLKREEAPLGETYTLTQLLEKQEDLGLVIEEENIVITQADQTEEKWSDERSIQIPILFVGDNEYTISVHCTDTAGNEGKSPDAASFVVDKINPEMSASYFFEDHTPAKGTVYQERNYYCQTVEAILTLKEHNFNPDMANPVIKIDPTLANGDNAEDNKNEALLYETDGKWIKDENNADTYHLKIIFNGNANYDMHVEYRDPAENSLEQVEHSQKLTVDKTAPDLVKIESSTVKGYWDKLLDVITFQYFSKDPVNVSIWGNDTESAIQSIAYYVSENEESKTQLTYEQLEKKEFTEAVKDPQYDMEPFELPVIDPNVQFIVYERITNYAGLTAYYNSDGIIADNTVPTVTLELANEDHMDNGIFKDTAKLKASAMDPVNITYSGLAKFYYQVTMVKNGETDTKEFTISPESKKMIQNSEKWEKNDIELSAEDWNSNNVKVQAFATDLSGNTGKSKIIELKMDATKPAVAIAYDLNSPFHDIYFKEDRMATITFTERNFTRDRVNVHMEFKDNHDLTGDYTLDQLGELKDKEGNSLIEVNWTQDTQQGYDAVNFTDDRKTTAIVKFKGEEQYTYSISCTDQAGWKADSIQTVEGTKAPYQFTIDKTDPTLQVSYSEEGRNTEHTDYYNQSVTATLKLYEHNFDERVANPEVTITAVDVDGNEVKNTIANVKSWTRNPQLAIGKENPNDCYQGTITYQGDANYTFKVTYKDLADRTLVKDSTQSRAFTVDKSAPTEGSITISGLYGANDANYHNEDYEWSENWINQFLNTITFQWFSKVTSNAVMTGKDTVSVIEPLQYYKAADQMSESQLELVGESAWNTADKLKVDPDEQYVIYEKVTNYAGLHTYFSSGGVISDSTQPGPNVTVSNINQAQNGIFNEDVMLHITAEDPNAGNTYSGLAKVWYTVTGSGNVNQSQTITLVDNSQDRQQGNQTWSGNITIPAQVYNSNDVKVQVFAADFSGNEGKTEVLPLKIDVTEPKIAVSWDLNQPLNGTYYKETRTATVTVTDRNFDSNAVRFNISNTDGTQPSIGEWNVDSSGVSDSATSSCQVSFSADGDYTFTLGCTDLAGNSGEYGQTDEFTMDKTMPVIEVSYNNNDVKNSTYYKEARTATVTVKEHNFNASEVKGAITASLLGQGIPAPAIGSFSNNGDVHTAAVHYDKDGDYTFDVDYTDLAGNPAADFKQDSFTIDLTAPEVNIFDIEDKSANNDVVAPGVKYTDTNYDSKSVSILVEGANQGLTDIGKAVSTITNGESMKLNDFPREEKMDDLYKLTARIGDKAGNETEKSVLFSVNRYGSVYVLDTDTSSWLKKDGKTHTYINQEKYLGIIEYNVDDIDVSKITSNRDGELSNLKENQNYSVRKSGSEVQWKEYYYKIAASNFSEEGNYAVTLYSEDLAKNNMNNQTVKKADKKLPIEFTVDKTAPTIVVSGVEDGGQYRMSARKMTVDSKDNLALRNVTVSVNDEMKTYDSQQLREVNGVIDVDIPSANRWQEIKISAEDEAGNSFGNSKKGGKSQPLALAVLVTPNVVIQYYMNKPLFFGSIGTVAAAGALAASILIRRRKRIQ